MADKNSAEPRWGYEGDIGPEHWGDLCPAFALCKDGRAQSPIDIPGSAPTNTPDLRFNYQPSVLNIANNGRTVQVNCAAGSSLHVDGTSYQLLQYHFHNPSENTVDGVAAEMEIHWVHRNDEGGLAVVGAFLVDGAHNPAYAPVFDYMPWKVGDPMEITGLRVNPADLLPQDRTYWRWDGSLTTPPCSEGVIWLMMKSPVEVSARQIDTYKKLYTGNARPVQPMNERRFIVGQRNG